MADKTSTSGNVYALNKMSLATDLCSCEGSQYCHITLIEAAGYDAQEGNV